MINNTLITSNLPCTEVPRLILIDMYCGQEKKKFCRSLDSVGYVQDAAYK